MKYFTFISLLLFSIYSNSQNQIIIEDYLEDFLLKKVLSASGIETIANKTYIVSDNQNVLFVKNGQTIKSIPLNPSDSSKKIEKKNKKDFESLCHIPHNNKDYLMIVCSGSYERSRDTIYLFDTKKQKVSYKKNVRNLYNQIQERMKLAPKQLINIEASALLGESIFLFHRGNESGQNYLIEIPKTEFIDYLTSKNNIPSFKLKQLELPISEEFSGKAFPGISGAYTLNNNTILISYSLEATQSNYSDGEILASYIGVLDTTDMTVSSAVIPENKKPDNARVIKAEGVILVSKHKNNNSIIIATVSDNDKDRAEYLELKIRL